MTEDEYRQTLRVGFNRQEYWRCREYFLWLREDNGRGGFPEYVAEAKRRLAKAHSMKCEIYRCTNSIQAVQTNVGVSENWF